MVGTKKKLFSMLFLLKNPVKLSSDGRAHNRNRSRVVELIGREPLIFARVENGVTKFSPKRQKTPKFSKNILDQTTVFSGEFSFFGGGKTNFFGEGGGGGITSKLPSQ